MVEVTDAQLGQLTNILGMLMFVLVFLYHLLDAQKRRLQPADLT